MAAAFFDLDKTVISRSSIMAFAPIFRREGLVSRRTLAKGAWSQLLYVHRGAGPKKLARIQASVLALTAGWPQAEVCRIVADHLDDAIDPITYAEAVALIDTHRQAGRCVYLVSAAPEEVAEPIGRRLGVDGTIASRARLDEGGCFSGTIDRYAYGVTKAELIRELADRTGIDLAESWSYSDSATDAPMLEIVGHAVAVNPDRTLRRLAVTNGWEIATFSSRGVGSHADAVGATRALSRHRTRLAALVSTIAVMTTGGMTAWWMRRRLHVRQA